MATPITLRFLNDIEKRNVYQVQLALKMGYVNPNLNYLGVFPLHLAIENGDVDITAVLLMAGADPLLKSKPGVDTSKKITCGAELADAMAKEGSKSEYRVEAAIIAEMINDPQKLKERYAMAMEKVKAVSDRENKYLMFLVVGGLTAFGFMFWHFYNREYHPIGSR